MRSRIGKQRMLLCLMTAVLAIVLTGMTAFAAQSVFFGRYPQELVEPDSAEEHMLSEAFHSDGDCYVDGIRYIRKKG